MSFGINALISRVFDQYSDNVAIQHETQIITYKELEERSNSVKPPNTPRLQTRVNFI